MIGALGSWQEDTLCLTCSLRITCVSYSLLGSEPSAVRSCEFVRAMATAVVREC